MIHIAKADPTVQTATPPASNAPLQFLSSKHFTGCNIYHRTSVLLREVDFGNLSNVTSTVAGHQFVTDFIERFSRLKSLVPRCGLKEDFIARLQSGQAVNFEELLLEAACAVDTAVTFAMNELNAISYASIKQEQNHTYLVWSSEWPDISRRASALALTGLLELLPAEVYTPSPDDIGFTEKFRKLQKIAKKRYHMSPTTSILKLAAQKRGIPCNTLGRQHLMLGYGSKQQHFFSSMTSTTPVPAQKICIDKSLANERLTELRLPVAQQIKVRSLKAAYAAVEKLGFPIVIKPLKGKKGDGVTAGITSLEDIEPAFMRAQKTGSGIVLLETFVPGDDHRLLIINGKLVAASRRKPSTIVGDGQSTVEQLIDRLNEDPWRDGFRLEQIKKNAELYRLLKQAELAMDDVLSEAREIALHSVANLSTGGLPVDVTNQVHPDNRDMAERASAGVGLDVAGIDFLTTDISRSYREIGGAIVEINARPGLRMHTWPGQQGKSRDVAGDIVNLFYPPGERGRIPIAAIVGDKTIRTVARILDAILRGAGQSVGLTLRKGAFINGTSADLSETQQRRAPLSLLRDPQISTLVTTVSLRQAARRGLLFDECKVSVITDKQVEADTHLFHQGVEVAKRATTDCFVVGAGNNEVLECLQDLGTRQLILVSNNPDDPALQAHLKAGHTAVTTMRHDGKTRIAVLTGTELQASFKAVARKSRDEGGKVKRMRNGTMFAIGAAIGLGLSIPDLEKAFQHVPAIIEEQVNVDKTI